MLKTKLKRSSMANNENLKPPINKRSTKEQREIRSKGGKKSGGVRRALLRCDYSTLGKLNR